REFCQIREYFGVKKHNRCENNRLRHTYFSHAEEEWNRCQISKASEGEDYSHLIGPGIFICTMAGCHLFSGQKRSGRILLWQCRLRILLMLVAGSQNPLGMDSVSSVVE